MGQPDVYQDDCSIWYLNGNKDLEVTLLFGEINDEWPLFLLEHSGTQHIDGNAVPVNQTILNTKCSRSMDNVELRVQHGISNDLQLFRELVPDTRWIICEIMRYLFIVK